MTFPPAEPGFALPLEWLRPWMSEQRWYANRGALPVLEEIGSLRMPSPGDATVIVHLLLDHTVGKPALYQVPLSYRRQALRVGWIGDLDGWQVHDAPHDPEFAQALLGAILAHRVLTIGHRILGAVTCEGTAPNPVLPQLHLEGEVVVSLGEEAKCLYGSACRVGADFAFTVCVFHINGSISCDPTPLGYCAVLGWGFI